VTVGTTTLTPTSNIFDNQRGGEPVIGTFTRSFGGNPTLKPEESVSKNGGIVIDLPGRLLRGLSFSADYYQIDYTDRSGGPGTQVLFDFFPERVTRGPNLPGDPAGWLGPITSWDATNINLAGVKTKGWDYRLRYSRTVDWGDIMVSLAMTDPGLIITQATPAAVPNSTFGQRPRRFSGSFFWARGPWDAGLSVNHQNRYYISGPAGVPYPSYTEWNPQVSYDFGRNTRFGGDNRNWWMPVLKDSKLSVTIINAFNREPSKADAINSRIIMDPRLRRYIVSYAKKF
jgi:iron complex outermembrane recepter protein